MKCFRCNFVPFFLQTSLKVGNSTGSSLSHFALQNAPHILYWRQVGTAGRPVKYPTLFLRSQDFVMCAECGFCIVLLKYAWTSLEKMSSWRQHIVLQISMYFSSLMVPSQKCKLPFAKGTDTTPYHDRPWLLTCLLVTVWMILFFFGPEHTASIPPKNTWNTDSSDHSTRFHCVMVHPQMPPSPEKSTALLDTVNIGFLLAQYSF